jgi:hypothetical protein
LKDALTVTGAFFGDDAGSVVELMTTRSIGGSAAADSIARSPIGPRGG